MAQGTPPIDVAEPAADESAAPTSSGVTRFQQMKSLIKKQTLRAIDGKNCPPREEWRPLSSREKFHVFVHHTYAPTTFISAAVSASFGEIRHNNMEYEAGLAGWGQRYGVELGTSETSVFFESFLFPTVLKQDPRYFRAPTLPLMKRTLYSVTRVIITRSDKGNETFNASRVLGSGVSEALSGLYVPGQRQGMRSIAGRAGFDLLSDAGLNLVREFWPDVRRKFLHR